MSGKKLHAKTLVPQGTSRTGKGKVAPLSALFWGRCTPQEQAEFQHAYKEEGFRRMSEIVRELCLAYARSQTVRDSVRLARTIAA